MRQKGTAPTAISIVGDILDNLYHVKIMGIAYI